MIDITTLKGKVKDLVESVTQLPAFYDMVPLGKTSGVFLSKGSTSFTGRTIDGNAHVATHEFTAVIFTFEGAQTCDDLTTAFVNATDGKASGDFRLIMVNEITPIEYDPDIGFWGNAVSIEFAER